MTKHTKGKWIVIETEEGRFMVYDNEQELICSAKNKANAHLIASAPDLLEVCKDTLRIMHFEQYKKGTIGDNLRIQLEQAISKAEGK